MGTGSGSLIHVICEEVGPDVARKFLGHTQWLVNYWLLQQGFSIGIGDTIADATTMEKINETISKAKNDVKDLIKQAQEKALEPEPVRTMMESFENRVNQVLNKARDDAGSSAQKSLSESNNLKVMVTAGSKGSFINISQMTACRQMSITQIEHSETMERGKAKPGRLSDPRLRTIDRKTKCETCTSNMAECPGHFGHLELANRCFTSGFLRPCLQLCDVFASIAPRSSPMRSLLCLGRNWFLVDDLLGSLIMQIILSVSVDLVRIYPI